MTTFGLPGQPATALEADLIDAAELLPAAHGESANAIIMLAKLHGPDLAVAVLDLLGGCRLHMPTRDEFFAALFRPHRDRHIAARRRQGAAIYRIAKEQGVSCETVRKALRRTVTPRLPGDTAKTVNRPR